MKDASGPTSSTGTRRWKNVATKPAVEQPRPAVNEALQKNARRTEDDTWDVTTTRIVYTPKDTGTLIAGSQGARTEAKVGVNQTSVPVGGVGGINVVRRISAQPNDHGSFSTTEERIVYIPDQKTATGGTTSQQETVETGVNQTEIPEAIPEVNKRVDVSVSMNDHGSMTTQRRTIVYQQQQTVSTSTYATEIRRTTVTENDLQTNPSAVMGEASAQPNDHGSATTRITELTPIAKDSGWITWRASVKASRGTYYYELGVRVFRNLPTPPSPPANKDGHVSVNINQYGLYDGSVSYRHLVDWEENASGGQTGGITNGVKRIYDKKGKLILSLEVICFSGSGNEGTESYWRANGIMVEGVKLNSGVYIKRVYKDPSQN